MPTVANRPRISVVVPCYKAADHVEKCLGSLLAQSLDPALFEVLLVFNGPKDAAEGVAQRLLERSSLRWRILHSEPGAGVARNAGVSHAEGEWVTFLDVDDEISANYLALLLASASDPGIIPVAGMVDVDEAGREQGSPIQSQILAAPIVNGGAEIASVLAIVVLKLLPTEVARRYPFDIHLRSGEDVALFAFMAGREGLSFDTSPAHAGAVYRRHIRSGSVGRQGDGFDFLVEQRLDVIKILESQVPTGGHLANLLRTFMTSQARFVARYLEANPQDQDLVTAAIRRRDLQQFPWWTLRLHSDQFFAAGRFPPSSHPASIAAGKGLVLTGGIWNVITRREPLDPTDGGLLQLSHESAASVALAMPDEQDGAAQEYFEPSLESTVDRAWEILQESDRAEMTRLRTWAADMEWPHIFGALVKARCGTTVSWHAELVEPHGAGLDDEPAQTLGPGWLADELTAAVEDAGFVAPAVGSHISHWIETLAAALADQVSFSTTHQLVAASQRMAIPQLRERLERVSALAEPLTLPPGWYSRGAPMAAKEPGVTHVGYFGDVGLGLQDVLAALGALPAQAAAKVRLHVFTTEQATLAEALTTNPNRARVTAYQALPFLRYLQATTHFDVVVVADSEAADGAAINDRVPWQWADLVGSGTPVWKVVDTGSELSRSDSAHTSRLGEPASCLSVLMQLAGQVS